MKLGLGLRLALHRFETLTPRPDPQGSLPVEPLDMVKHLGNLLVGDLAVLELIQEVAEDGDRAVRVPLVAVADFGLDLADISSAALALGAGDRIPKVLDLDAIVLGGFVHSDFAMRDRVDRPLHLRFAHLAVSLLQELVGVRRPKEVGSEVRLDAGIGNARLDELLHHEDRVGPRGRQCAAEVLAKRANEHFSKFARLDQLALGVLSLQVVERFNAMATVIDLQRTVNHLDRGNYRAGFVQLHEEEYAVLLPLIPLDFAVT